MSKRIVIISVFNLAGCIRKVIDRSPNGSLMLKFLMSIFFAVFMSEGIANCNPLSSEISNRVDARQWIKDHFAKGNIPPFSFVYGGKDSDNFIRNWQYRAKRLKSTNSNVEETVYSYYDKQNGLMVKCTVICFNDFNAVEWVLKFSNTSVLNSPLIEKVEVVNQHFKYNRKGAFILHHAKGSDMLSTDFMPIDDTLQISKSLKIMPDGIMGSSNKTAFPFFNIESPSSEGIMVAVGWTGKWYANVQQMDSNTVLLKSGMDRMKLTLYPDEEIRTPKICLLFWKGEDRMVGHNQFRQFILAHHTPKIDGHFVEPPLSAALGWGGPSPCHFCECLTESYAVAAVERFKQFDIVSEVCWVDAGWYKDGDEWWQGVGNWVADDKRFPNGLKPVSDAVHAAGAKFLLWFEPERVRKGTIFEKEHPEWLLEYPWTKGKDDLYRNDTYLFDLGKNAARLWLTNYISDFIRKEGVDYYRQDFNTAYFRLDPEESWKMKEKPDRIGMSEIRYIEGLYAFWDSLLVRFPSLVIDNCASGGRRIDLETISRSIPLWRSDYDGAVDPNGYQNHTYGLNFYLPLHGINLSQSSQYDFLSSMSSAMVLIWDINSPGISVPQVQKCMNDFKRLRPYYYGDYYPLTGTASLLRDDEWLAHQLNRPEKGDGIIMSFRRKNCNEKFLIVKLRGLDPKESYDLIEEDSDIKLTKTGEELLAGYTLTLNEKTRSLLIWYKKRAIIN